MNRIYEIESHPIRDHHLSIQALMTSGKPTPDRFTDKVRVEFNEDDQIVNLTSGDNKVITIHIEEFVELITTFSSDHKKLISSITNRSQSHNRMGL